ncbi:transmembrane protease serine 4 [Puma concolor]|uniref:Transmembrane protease serine 4 n=1 Tax=Puma concolor TaxID=9696 RepID=A0A6P6IAF3_PUMCO|nr:transmembrane protease serine 4 [Puma concolor]
MRAKGNGVGNIQDHVCMVNLMKGPFWFCASILHQLGSQASPPGMGCGLIGQSPPFCSHHGNRKTEPARLLGRQRPRGSEVQNEPREGAQHSVNKARRSSQNREGAQLRDSPALPPAGGGIYIRVLEIHKAFTQDPGSDQPLNSFDVTPLRKPRTPLETFKKVGVPIIAALLSLATIIITAVLIKVILDKYYFLCGQPLHFIPRKQVCDGQQDCASGEDEQLCVKNFPDGSPVTVRLSRDRSTLQVLDPATRSWVSACFDNFTEALAKIACGQMGYDSKPSFKAVGIGPDQDLDVVGITENSQELQVRNLSGPCLSGSLVSLHCLESERQGYTCGPQLSSGHSRHATESASRRPGDPLASSVTLSNALDLCEVPPPKKAFRPTAQGDPGRLPALKRSEEKTSPVVQLTLSASWKHLDVPNWKVRAGSDKLGNFPSLPVADIFVIELNTTYPKEKDVALVKLQFPLTFSGTVRPICLPFFDEELPPATPLWVIGWGFTEQDGGKMSDTLLQASVQVIDHARCNAEDAYQGEVTEKMLCAGILEGGVDTCQGDSGGPLMYHSDLWQVVGIVSWGHGCGGPSTPGVYTKVTSYLNWIYSVRKVSLPVVSSFPSSTLKAQRTERQRGGEREQIVEASPNRTRLSSPLLPPHGDTTAEFPVRDPDSSMIPSLSKGPLVGPLSSLVPSTVLGGSSTTPEVTITSRPERGQRG